ncbi:MAG: pyruvate kinase [Candidatus Margulisiibacteriota bacterium]|nr:MAG: pyruvate kinase [Candidatus Margulisiibacteriota bacterium]HAR64070.1 pyruvate kinase [Candidatus Margulisiibacteriota bacterium]HCT84958.1 pyruvate kinase [Candidatus Margulisiibacteriota bacterium]HCY37180.1 pyruvate kinase [Candidatus Margulisiibacteriota bacterium]
MKRINTKIIATIGPSSNSEAKIIELIHAGATIFRINTSHEAPEEHKRRIDLIRSIAKKLNMYIPIILDLQGPKIRVGILTQPIQLNEGDIVKLKYGMTTDEPGIIPVDYKGIVENAKIGERLLFNDGRISSEIIEKKDEYLTIKIVDGGELSSRKGLNIPGSTANIPSVTERDKEFIKFAVENDIDYIALSFIRTGDDILQARQCLRDLKSDIPIIAKIEKPQAVENLGGILEVADGIMVARGDLGIELSPEKVPIVQKRIIIEANIKGKTVITATQMLESMITESIPTRAEASDVANAIIDGTDVVMLSGETAVGKHPKKTVKMMNNIAHNVETSSLYKELMYAYYLKTGKKKHSQHFAIDIIRAFNEVDISAIVAFTRTGYTARLLSKARVTVPTIALCDNVKLCRQMNLLWGIFPYYMELDMNFTEKFIKEVDELLIDKTFLKLGDNVIMTVGLPYLAMGKTNFVRLHQLGSTTTVYE